MRTLLEEFTYLERNLKLWAKEHFRSGKYSAEVIFSINTLKWALEKATPTGLSQSEYKLYNDIRVWFEQFQTRIDLLCSLENQENLTLAERNEILKPFVAEKEWEEWTHKVDLLFKVHKLCCLRNKIILGCFGVLLGYFIFSIPNTQVAACVFGLYIGSIIGGILKFNHLLVSSEEEVRMKYLSFLHNALEPLLHKPS